MGMYSFGQATTLGQKALMGNTELNGMGTLILLHFL